jgi:hypothetical protein
MSIKLLSPADILSPVRTIGCELPAGILSVRDVVVDSQYCSAYDRHTGKIIAPSVIRRGSSLGMNPRIMPCLSPEQLAAAPTASLDSTGILIPIPFNGANHFGHLTTEIVGMLYPLLLEEELLNDAIPVLIGSIPWRKSSKFHSSLSKILKPTVIQPEMPSLAIGKLWIPMPTLYLRHSFSGKHREALRRVLPLLFNYEVGRIETLPKVCETKKIYLSRANLPGHQRRIINEERLQELLIGSGWDIVHPQQLPVMAQIEILSEARIVAGCLGSAFHLLQYLGDENISRKTILTLATDRSHFLNYALQFAAQSAAAWCLVALDRDPLNPKKDINQDLLLPEDQIHVVFDWLERY